MTGVHKLQSIVDYRGEQQRVDAAGGRRSESQRVSRALFFFFDPTFVTGMFLNKKLTQIGNRPIRMFRNWRIPNSLSRSSVD
jgi:hypothetical protein